MTAETHAGRASARRRPPLVPIALLIGSLAAAAGLWLGASSLREHRAPPPPALRDGTALVDPRPLADFALVDQDGKPFTLANLEGHWTFLAIGYTSCPDICPLTMGTFEAIDRKLAQTAGATPRPRFLFVSVDPERDTPERLAKYVRWYNRSFLAATGEDAQLRALAAQLGLLYARVEAPNSVLGYLMDHSAAIVLIDPKGRLAAVFGGPHNAQAIAADYLTLANERPGKASTRSAAPAARGSTAILEGDKPLKTEPLKSLAS